MTTIVRIGDYLYADSKISFFGNQDLIKHKANMLKILPYENHPVTINGASVNSIGFCGDLSDVNNFLSFLQDLVIDKLHDERKQLEVSTDKPVEIISILKFILNHYQVNDDCSLAVVFCCMSSDNESPIYSYISFSEETMDDFPPNSIVGS